jgi:hypothetical protein
LWGRIRVLGAGAVTTLIMPQGTSTSSPRFREHTMHSNIAFTTSRASRNSKPRSCRPEPDNPGHGPLAVRVAARFARGRSAPAYCRPAIAPGPSPLASAPGLRLGFVAAARTDLTFCFTASRCGFAQVACAWARLATLPRSAYGPRELRPTWRCRRPANADQHRLPHEGHGCLSAKLRGPW